MTINDRIKELDIILPQAKPPVGSYVATKITGNLLFISIVHFGCLAVCVFSHE